MICLHQLFQLTYLPPHTLHIQAAVGWCLFWEVCILGFPSSSEVKNLLPCRIHRRWRFELWVGKIPWMRKWQPTLVFLPGESRGQRSLAVSFEKSLTPLSMHIHWLAHLDITCETKLYFAHKLWTKVNGKGMFLSYWIKICFLRTSWFSALGIYDLYLRHIHSTTQLTFKYLPSGEGNGNPLQNSCLGNPMDRGEWWATVMG